MGSRDHSTGSAPDWPSSNGGKPPSTLLFVRPWRELPTDPPIPTTGELNSWLIPLPAGVILPPLELNQPLPIPAALNTDPEAMALSIAGLEAIAGEHERRLREAEAQIWTLIRRL